MCDVLKGKKTGVLAGSPGIIRFEVLELKNKLKYSYMHKTNTGRYFHLILGLILGLSVIPLDHRQLNYG